MHTTVSGVDFGYTLSVLHHLSFIKKVKFIVDAKLVSISGEEDIIAMTSTYSLYIKVNAVTVKYSFRAFKVVNATFIAEGFPLSKPYLSKGTHMGLKIMMRKGA